MDPFGTVVIVVAVVAAAVAALSYLGSGRIYRGLGRTGLALDEPELRPGPAPGTSAHAAEAEEELRQLLEAKSARRQARGEPAIDVEAEVARLGGPSPAVAADPALREEVRELVVAANERRVRRGEEPVDVEPEVDRRLRELAG